MCGHGVAVLGGGGQLHLLQRCANPEISCGESFSLNRLLLLMSRVLPLFFSHYDNVVASQVGRKIDHGQHPVYIVDGWSQSPWFLCSLYANPILQRA